MSSERDSGPSPEEHTFVMPSGTISPLPVNTETSRTGQMFGEFKLLRRLGRGGMAEVWLAEQLKPKRQVALKFMHAELMNDPLFVKRFEREADAAAGLTHANIVQVYSTGTVENQHYIAQEFVEGQTLRDYLRKLSDQSKRISVNASLTILRQIASALEAAAEKGIVHRDIKPENIMLTEKGNVKVADFGLAQIEQGGEKLHLTQADTTMGTPLYMSPEQIRAEKLDQRSDLYSFGVMAYHMLCGYPPFRGETAMAVAVQHLQSTPPPLLEKRPDLPKPLGDMVHRLLRKKPEERYQSFTDVIEDLRLLSKAHKSGTITEVQIGDADPFEARPAQRIYGKRPWLTLTLLTLLAGSASAGVGWWMRPQIGPTSEAPLGVERKTIAREQYLHAMLLVDQEDAWLAVRKYFGNSPTDKLWVGRAEEQLLLLYLKDKSRTPEAEAQIKVLAGMRGDNERFYIESRLAQAYLAAGARDRNTLRSILATDRENFRTKLEGPWRALFADLEFQANGPAPAGGPGSPPPRPNDEPPREPRPSQSPF